MRKKALTIVALFNRINADLGKTVTQNTGPTLDNRSTTDVITHFRS